MFYKRKYHEMIQSYLLKMDPQQYPGMIMVWKTYQKNRFWLNERPKRSRKKAICDKTNGLTIS